jgi:hypothetical protein
MRGKARTIEEKHELFKQIEPHLKEGLSVRKACEITSLPYSTMRDLIQGDLLLRTKMSIAQSELLSLAWKSVRTSLQTGDVKTAQWYIEKMGMAEPLADAFEGGLKEQDSRDTSMLYSMFNGKNDIGVVFDTMEEIYQDENVK